MANQVTYEVEGPGGVIYEVTGPEDATDEQLVAAARQQWELEQKDAAAGSAAQEEAPPKEGLVSRVAGGAVKELAGAADTGMQLLSGALAQPVGGLAGLGVALGAKAVGSDRAMELGAKANEKMNDWFTWEPVTEAGKKNQRAIAMLGEAAAPVMEKFSDVVEDMTSNPVTGERNPGLATVVHSSILAIPEVFGVKVGTGANAIKMAGLRDMKLAQRYQNNRRVAADLKKRRDVAAAEAERMGLKLTNYDVKDSVVQVAEGMAPDRHKAMDMEKMRESIVKSDAAAKAEINRLYEEARATRAFADVTPLQAAEHRATSVNIQRGFDVAEMPMYQKSMQEFRQLHETLPGSTMAVQAPGVKPPARIKSAGLNNVDILEQRLSRRIDAAKGADGRLTPEGVALIRLRKEMRKALNEQFDNGLIRGDQTAIDKWKAARGADRIYKQTFKADRVIRNMLVTNNATAREVYSWVIGASANGMKPQAARTVTRLKEILGPDHQGIKDLRRAVLRDVMEPLFAETPNFKAAVRSIDRLLLDNREVAAALDIDVKELETLKRGAHAARFAKEIGPQVTQGEITKIATRMIWGHDIAKAGVKVNLARKIADWAVDTGVMTPEKLAAKMAEVGYDRPMVAYDSPEMKDILIYGAMADPASDFEHEKEERKAALEGE